MSLIGYERKSERKNGGIRSLALVNQGDVLNIGYSYEERGVIALTLPAGQKMATFQFREDEAEYRETISVVNGSPVVTHELRFILDKMGPSATNAIGSLLTTSSAGLLALVTTMNDEVFMVGYSLRFGKERPLRVTSVTGTTGKQLRDETTEVVLLQSVDTDKAMPFLGDTGELL